MPLYNRYTETVSADPENKTGNKTGIRILPDGSSGLRIWCKRYFRICRFRTEPESESEELAAIIASSAESFSCWLKEEPVVAMLSHSTKGSAKHADVDKKF